MPQQTKKQTKNKSKSSKNSEQDTKGMQDTRDQSQLKKDKKFKDVYLRHRKRIYWYVYRKISRAPEAEDITADVFMKLYENWNEVEKRGKNGIQAWLYTVARNASIDFLRKASTQSNQSLDAEEMTGVAKVFENFVGEAIKDEEIAMIKDALDVLDEVEMEILKLRFEEEMKFKQIAEIVDKREGACKMVLYRSIEKLKNHINSENTESGTAGTEQNKESK